MRARFPALVVVLTLSFCLGGCGPSDPLEHVLKERARWHVTLEGWAAREDGSIALSVRVSGPVRSNLERLTLRFVLEDKDGTRLGSEWQTLDLSGIERGGPKELLLRLEGYGADVEQIGIDSVPDPSPQEIPHIEELRR